MEKAEECLKQEEERVQNYLHQSSKSKLLKQVETELLAEHKQALIEKETSGCRSLLRDDKVIQEPAQGLIPTIICEPLHCDCTAV